MQKILQEIENNLLKIEIINLNILKSLNNIIIKRGDKNEKKL